MYHVTKQFTYMGTLVVVLVLFLVKDQGSFKDEVTLEGERGSESVGDWAKDGDI